VDFALINIWLFGEVQDLFKICILLTCFLKFLLLDIVASNLLFLFNIQVRKGLTCLLSEMKDVMIVLHHSIDCLERYFR